MTSERIEAFYRDATAADVARVMNGEEVEARFSDEMTAFFDSTLVGWIKDCVYVWVDGDGARWQFCQVYDPPQWWLEKPEPGEGYRLLGKFPAEDLHDGDEVFEDGKWEPSRNLVAGFQQQSEAVWYRRRIEQPLLPGHQWLSPGDRLACGDSYYHKGAVQEIDQAYWGNLICIEKAFMRRIEQSKPEPKHYALQVGYTYVVPSGHWITVTEHGIEVQ